MVPIDERGRLNAKHFIDGGKVFDEKRKEWVEKRGQKLRELQDDYAHAMEPLGLERGIKGSIHTIKSCNASTEQSTGRCG